MKKQTITKYIVSGSKRFRFSVADFAIRKTKRAVIEPSKGEYYDVKIGKRKFSGRPIQKKQNKIVVELNGNFYSFTIDQEKTVKRTQPLKKAAGQSGNYFVKAPMPGKIKEIFVSKGNMVKKGEPILILEAMKMQNQVLASTDSTVLDVKVKEDQTVLGDQELIVLQAIQSS